MKVKKKTTTVVEEIIVNNEWTHIVSILDRSGSMINIIGDCVGGFNQYIKNQKNENLGDKVTITVALFDDKYDLLYNNVDINDVDETNIKKRWIPRGTTALLDAIGKTINTTKQEYNLLGDVKPTRTLCVIVTDGLENASKEYSHDMIKNLIKDCEENGWTFIYLAANQDAFEVGSSLGINGGNTYTYTTTSSGVADMMSVLYSATFDYRVNTNNNYDENHNLIEKITTKKT